MPFSIALVYRIAVPRETSSPTPLFWMLASLVAFLATFVTVVTLVLRRSTILFGLTNPFFYIALLALGCSAALLLFGAMRGYAKWKGRVLSGTLQIGGPVAIAALTVFGGYFFRPEIAANFVVRVHGPEGRTATLCPKSVRLFLGQDVRAGDIGQNCQAQFNEIPTRFLGSD